MDIQAYRELAAGLHKPLKNPSCRRIRSPEILGMPLNPQKEGISGHLHCFDDAVGRLSAGRKSGGQTPH